MDDVSKSLDDTSEKLAQAPDAVSKLAEEGIGQVEEKIDTFVEQSGNLIDTLENFLKKF